MGEAELRLVRTIAAMFSGNWVEIFGDPARRAELVERLRPLVTPDLEYRSAVTAGQVGFEESYRGIDGLTEANVQFIEEFEYFSTEAHEFVDVGDGRVLIHGENVIRTHGGDEMRFPGSALATIEDGRVCRYHSFGSRADAERAVGLQ